MNPGSKTTDQHNGPTAPDYADLFQTEVEFWRELISTSRGKQSKEILERMHQAMTLAEAKLASLAGASGMGSSRTQRNH